MTSGPWGRPLAGRLDEHTIHSPALVGNPLGDPASRPLWVYTPPHVAADQPTPVVYQIQGFTGHLEMWRNHHAFRPTVLERLDAAMAAPDHPPVRVVFADCWTSLGGSQFLDSPATGRYHTYLCEDVVGFVDAGYPTLAAAGHRGIAGKSSGGYGAMVTPMLRPDVFGALATHAGDGLFEMCYAKDCAVAARALRDRYDGSYTAFWDDFTAREPLSRPDDGELVNVYAMAACYSADADGTVQLPFEAATGRWRDDVWVRWQAWDPVRMVARHAAALRGLKAVWVDAGTRDEYWLDVAAAAFVAALRDVGVEPTHYELFDAGHGGIEYRYPAAIRHLAERLQP